MYTIQLLNGDVDRMRRLDDALMVRIEKDGRFRVGQHMVTISNLTGRENQEANRPYFARFGVPTLYMQAIRLVNPKPYCGQHPGPCQLNGRPKPKTRLLEWDDWVAFHNLVNAFLNQRHVKANVFTTPRETRGKFWIRKNLNPRIRYDYDEESRGGFLVPLRVWNNGTPDQFKFA